MSQWSTLTRFQRVLLIALTALLAVFTVVYPVLSRRKGIQYRDALLLWSAQGENDVYAGRVDGARHGRCAHRGGGPRRSGYPFPGRLV